MIDPAQKNQQTDIVYPVLVKLLNVIDPLDVALHRIATAQRNSSVPDWASGLAPPIKRLIGNPIFLSFK
jgi:hypothetical protein